MKALIAKLQSLSEAKKRIVFFAIIGVAVLILGFFQVLSTIKHVAVIQKSVQSIKLPAFEVPDNGNKLKDITKLIDELKPDTFQMSYPAEWKVDQAHSSDSAMSLIYLTETEEAGLHIELVSKTENVTSAEKGIDAVKAKMKEVLVAKKGVTVGLYKGYEIIGTLGDANSQFSVTYIEDEQGNVFEIQYGESTKAGWKPYKDWKKYEQFKEIISTFSYIK